MIVMLVHSPLIVVVDDDPVFLKVAVELSKQAVASLSGDVQGFASPEEALAHLRAVPPYASSDLVIVSDLHLNASSSGKELLEAARARHPGARLILMSGSHEDLQMADAKVDAVLPKPLEGGKYRALLERLATEKRFWVGNTGPRREE